MPIIGVQYVWIPIHALKKFNGGNGKECVFFAIDPIICCVNRIIFTKRLAGN